MSELGPGVLSQRASALPPPDRALRLLRRRVFDQARAGSAIRVAVIVALVLHLALGALFIARPPAFLAALRHVKRAPPREAEIELVENNMATAGDGPVGGNHGASAAPTQTRPMPPAQATPPTPPTPQTPRGPGDISASPPPAPARPTPADPIQMNLTGSDSAQGISGGTADQPAVADPKAINKKPAYPRRADELGEHGMVSAVITVTADGHAGSVVVVQTSGWPALDTAAVQAWQTWRFKPAMIGGAPAPSQVNVSIDFTLNQP